MAGSYIMEGPLSKWTNLMKGWQYRWFVLDDNVGLLSYYTSREKRVRGERRGCVRLQGAVIGIDDEDDSTFTITVDQKTFHFQAKHADEKEQWINCLESSIMKISQPKLPSFTYSYGLANNATMSDFDKKLAEADSYLKILIEQIQDLDARMKLCCDEKSFGQFQSLKSSAEILVESIKQTIVFLQISKHNIMQMNTSTTKQQQHYRADACNTMQQQQQLQTSTVNGDGCPVIDTIVHRSAECLVDSSASDVQCAMNHDHHHPHHLQPNHSALSNSLPNLLTPSEDFHDIQNQDGLSKATNPTTASPATAATATAIPVFSATTTNANADTNDDSYSSSDDDDRYYDAEDVSREFMEAQRCRSLSKSINKRPGVDVYEEDDDEEEGIESMENHGNLLTHLLSQLHIGMDLTKVVLPTFILEKRSLLEMYSDFLAHPDLFVSIAEQSTAKDRLVQTVRFYLSAFHAGKKSGVAKKPYNPILGECFKCFYELPQTTCTSTAETRAEDKDGPIPWCSKSNLSFVAEQVSHHPPISAFYAECYNKRISINGYIWTKSKFLGLSVGVHMIGQAVISLLDHDEDYVVTFPNGYGRSSILTVPWMELGGKVSITCSKTGYSAQIEFLTKPFYGGKKDQVVAEMFGPNDKKAFASVRGEWNGVMFLKQGNVSEVFLDTKNMPIIKKQVKPVDQQEDFESRRLWRNVTVNLKSRNIEKATDYKCQLEQHQRDEAKRRKDNCIHYETKLFHEVGAHWVFDKPLVNRIKSPTGHN
ncbi:hypothetical protein HELRODRAFT_105256 [Helobdella robusta]|uniref:Oxysterol-binding protein n=1 Tax=Helobdella robusta TaxID=6412 RepID=T1EDS4_HELRO|nr:hypothetical protein HELRODRAFT_105256 [Helobdella robusta]ESO12249.1 hypothetical protein HELRODRAFT_105256 [Helobdella robusta]